MAEWDTRAAHGRIVDQARVPRGGKYNTIGALLPLMDQHLRTLVVPRLLEVAEDWLTTTASVPLVASVPTYRLPWRCLRVLDVALLNAAGDPLQGFSRANAEQAKRMRSGGLLKKTGRPEFWLMEASSLRLYPTPSASDAYTLAIRFARRPGRLVDSQGEDAWRVADFDASSGDASIEGFALPGVGRLFDFISGTPGFESLQDDVRILTAVEAIPPAGSTPGLYAVRVTSWSGVAPQSDDYMVTAGCSPVPQVPLDYLAVLELAVTEQLLRDGGDMAGAESAKGAKLEMRTAADSVLEPRASEPETCVNDDWL